MTRRKWLVRGLVFSVLGGVTLAGWLYQRWTNPIAVRRQVIDILGSHFVGATISLDSASLRLLGGISVTDLRLTRRDDPDKIDFAHIPSAIFYHDKEQLLEGRLVLRKIELRRPRIRVIRSPDGRWNLENVLGPVHPEIAIPTIVIQQGTVLLEDYSTATRTPVRLEIKDVNLTLINDPLSTVTFQAKGMSELSGALRASGTWLRTAGDTTLALTLPAIPVQLPLIQCLGAYSPAAVEHARQLRGIGKLQVEMSYRPQSERPWKHDCRVQLAQGTFTHPHLPLALDHLEVALRCRDGQVTFEKLTGQSGPTRVDVKRFTARPRTAVVSTPPNNLSVLDQFDIDGAVQIDRLLLTQPFFASLPEDWRTIETDYAPSGSVNLLLEFDCREGKWNKHCVIHPQDLKVRYRKFPYVVEHLQGMAEHRTGSADHPQELILDLVGQAGSSPIYIKGKVLGPDGSSQVHVDIWSDNVVMNNELQGALGRYQALAQSFAPAGRLDFIAQIRREAGKEDFANRFVIHFHHASMRYDIFPYPLENVSLTLDIQPGHWEYRDFHGTHKGFEVRSRGGSQPTPAGDRVAIDIQGTNLNLDGELEEALAKSLPRLRQSWRAFAPTGRLSFHALVDSLPGQPQDVDVTVNVNGCTIQPNFFPYVLQDVSGSVRYAHQKVHVGQFHGRHGDTVFSLDKGEVILKPDGGFYAQLDALTGNPIVPTAEFLEALPPALRTICQRIQLRDPLTLNTQLIIDLPSEAGKPPVIYWDGGVQFQDATLYAGVLLEHITGQVCCYGRYCGQLEGVLGNVWLDQMTLFKQPFRNLHCKVVVPRDKPQVLCLPDLVAHIYGGDVGGEVRFEFGPTIRYDVNLTALRIQLEELGRQNLDGNAQLSGSAMARLFLTGRGTDTQGLEGRGSIDVPSGKMYNLPVFLDLLKVLGLRLPDRTAFEEAHAAFTVRGPRVSVSRLDLYGHAISLSGQGEMNLDGSDLQLDFYAVWGRLVQWLPPIIREIPPTIGQYLLKVKVRGKVGEVRYDKEPVPVLVEPAEKLLRWMTGKNAQPQGKLPKAADFPKP